MRFQVAYIPIGVPTFDLESAQAEFEKSVQLLQSLTGDVVCPQQMLLLIEDLNHYLDTIQPDLIILQNVTFANGAYVSEILKRFHCPLLLWTLREPVIDGGRLRLNSLTGAYSAANAIRSFRQEPFEYVFGSADESAVITMVDAVIRAAKTRHQVSHLKMAAIGHTPQGFGFGRALDAELMQCFGVTLEAVEARELIDRAKSYSEADCREYLVKAETMLNGLEDIPKQNQNDFARLYKAYSEYIQQNGIGAIASRCWPDFFTSFGTPVCSVLGLLNAKKLAASCEADIYGALSMYIGTELTNQATFFGDPVSLNEQEGTITFWHCGMAASTLAREDTGAQTGLHPNRKLGPVMDFGCQACDEVTIFRVGRKPNGSFRFFIAKGAALDKPKQFCGTSVVVKTQGDAAELVKASVKDGWEPHFVVVYKDVTKELEILAHMLNLEVCIY